MEYTDKIYGTFLIDEPIIQELIDSPTLQRLKDISQAGHFEPFFPGSYHTRFEHSVGDYYLLARFGATIEEQVAGLIHDVSHTAFSHCADYIGDQASQKNHDFQDNMFESFVRSSEIPHILQKYGLSLEYILDDSHFPLKETNIPDLCTDRMDYSLRSGVMYGVIDTSKVQYFLENITATNGTWIFKNFESASWYATLFLQVSEKYFANIESAVMLSSVGAYLKYALEKNYMTREDLWGTDSSVLAKLRPFHASDSHLQLLFERMDNKVPYVNDPAHYTEHVFCKSRVVDPLFFAGSEVKRVSDVNEEWKKVMLTAKEPKEYFIRFEK